jgi:hypothetical protein
MLRFLFKRLFGGSDDPSVNWSEIDTLRVIARETATDGYYRSASEQALCDAGDAFVLFTRVGDGKFLARTTIPKPLDPDQALIQRFQPEARSFGLHLHPAAGREPREVVCRRTWFGLWKDAGMDDYAFFTQLQSDDFARLERVRTQILPGPVPESVLAQERWNAKQESMTEDQRRVAFAQMMLEGTRRMDEMMDEKYPNLGPPPPDLANAAAALDQRKAQMLEDLKQRAGDRPLDPDMLHMLDGTVERARRESEQVPEEDPQ